MLRIAAAVNAAERDLYCRQCSQSCSNEPWFAKVLLVGRVSEAAPGVRCVLQSGNDNRPVHDLKCVVCMRVNLLVEKLIGLWMTRLLEAWGWLGRCTGLIQNWSVMEIGRNSACSLGAGVLGTGVIVARFHCCRVVELARDWNSLWNTGVPNRRNHTTPFDLKMLYWWHVFQELKIVFKFILASWLQVQFPMKTRSGG